MDTPVALITDGAQLQKELFILGVASVEIHDCILVSTFK